MEPPLDETTTIADLTRDPYPVYRRYRHETPIVRVAAAKRILVTKADDTKAIKDDPELWSSNDPGTPMEVAFQRQTLMRRDGADHARERGAMAKAFSPGNIKRVWLPLYQNIAKDYVGRLARGEIVDLHSAIGSAVSCRCLAHLIGLTAASDHDLARWSQTLIDGAGNFAWRDEPFAAAAKTNEEVDAAIDAVLPENRAEERPNALSAMLHDAWDGGEAPVEVIRSNIKIVIGGGINEPRDAFSTGIYGLLSNPEQKRDVVENGRWLDAFEETIRWVAPIQASSRRATRDTELRGVGIASGEVVMTIQASANHDEDHYENGHLFDVDRANRRHQSFGNGPHFCLGTHIARRMVAEILWPMLFDRFPAMELAGDVEFVGFGFRGPRSLPVRLL